MRLITDALQAHFNKPVTTLGYLIQVNATQVFRWSNVGDVFYQPEGFGGPVTWVDSPFTFDSVNFAADQDPSGNLVIDNRDNTYGALFQNEFFADVTLDIWQFSPRCLTSGDAPYLVQMVIDGFEATPEEVTVSLVAYGSINAFSPRRRIDVVNGFANALPPTTKITWGNEILDLSLDTSDQ